MPSEVTLLEIPPCQTPMCGVAYSCSYVLLIIATTLLYSIRKYSNIRSFEFELIDMINEPLVSTLMYIDVAENVREFDRINGPLTSRDVYFHFLEMLAMVVSESSFGANVCLRRPVGSTTTSGSCYHYFGISQQCI